MSVFPISQFIRVCIRKEAVHDESCITPIISSKHRWMRSDSFSKGGLIPVNKPWLLEIILHQFKKHILHFWANSTTPTPKTYRQVISHFAYYITAP